MKLAEDPVAPFVSVSNPASFVLVMDPAESVPLLASFAPSLLGLLSSAFIGEAILDGCCSSPPASSLSPPSSFLLYLRLIGSLGDLDATRPRLSKVVDSRRLRVHYICLFLTNTEKRRIDVA